MFKYVRTFNVCTQVCIDLYEMLYMVWHTWATLTSSPEGGATELAAQQN